VVGGGWGGWAKSDSKAFGRLLCSLAEGKKLLAAYAKLQEAEARLGQDEEPSV
jgi:hypothetical protein